MYTEIKSDINELIQDMLADFRMQISSNGSILNNGYSDSMSGSMMSPMMMSQKLWQELLPGLKDDQVINDVIYDCLKEGFVFAKVINE